MKNLLAKELRLATHPTNAFFLGLSALLIIPNYPYYVTFFYTMLGIYFLCLSGRENRDIPYSAALPVRKGDIVRARIVYATLIECAQFLLAVPFALLRQKILPAGNEVGMDANIAFFGLALLMTGLANLSFFANYYAAPDKVGTAFLKASTVMFLYMTIAETLTHVVPFFRDVLDTPDPAHLGAKLCVLAAGLAGGALFTLLGARVSVRRFEALDL